MLACHLNLPFTPRLGGGGGTRRWPALQARAGLHKAGAPKHVRAVPCVIMKMRHLTNTNCRYRLQLQSLGVDPDSVADPMLEPHVRVRNAGSRLAIVESASLDTRLTHRAVCGLLQNGVCALGRRHARRRE